MAEPAKYAVNPETGQVMRNDGTGWTKVKTAKNQQGQILINEGGAWTPLPQKSDPAAPPQGYSEPPKMSMLQAFDTSAKTGSRFGLADESQGFKSQFNMIAPAGPLGVFSDVGTGLAGLFMENNAEKTGNALDPRYTMGRDFARDTQAKAREDRPVTSFAGEVAGSAVYPGGALRLGAPIVREGVKLGAIGATQGALYGYASGEGDTQDRVEGAQTGAVVGGALGAAMPGAAAAALPVVRSARTATARIADQIVELFGGTGTASEAVAREVAEAAVRRSMERSGMTPERIAEALERFRDKPAVLAEVIGQDAINTLSSLTRRPGSTPQAAQDIIAERMGGFAGRAADDLRQTTGLTDAQIRGEFGPELQARREAAAPVYNELFEQQGNVASPRLDQLANTNAIRPMIGRAQEVASDIAVSQGRDPASVTRLEVLDTAKRLLDDDVARAMRNEDTTELVRLEGLRVSLLQELDTLTGGQYAAARQVGGEAPRLEEARRQGEQAMRPSVTRATVGQQVNALNPQDRPAFASGTASRIDEDIAGGRMDPRRFRLPATQEKVGAVFGEEAGGELTRRMSAEADLRDLAARWGPRQGSITGTVLESGPNEALDDGIRFATALARGDRIGFINQAVSWMRRRGYNQQQIDAMGELLLSNPQEGLRRLGVRLPGAPPGAAGAATPNALSGQPAPAPQGAPTPSTPIAAGGFGGFGGRTPDTVYRGATGDMPTSGPVWTAETPEYAAQFPLGDKTGQKILQAQGRGELLDLTKYDADQLLPFDEMVSALKVTDPEAIQALRASYQVFGDRMRVYSALGIPQVQKALGKSFAGVRTNQTAGTQKGVARLYFDAASLKGDPAASGLGLRTDASNALVGAGVGALGPAESNEERLRNMAIGAGVMGVGGRLSRTVGARNALAGETRTAGLPGSRGPKKPTVGKPKRDIGTKVADASAVAMLAAGGPTAQADTGDPQQRLEELSQRETAAQQLITDYEQGLKDFRSLSVVEKQEFLKANGFLGANGKPLVIDGKPEGNTAFAIKAYEAEIDAATKAAQAERELARSDINKVRVGMAERQENPPNPLIDKAAELGTYAAMIYGAHRLRGAATKGSREAARRVADDANALLTRLPVPPQPPKKTLLSRVPVVGRKEKARITKATNAANKAARAVEERLAGRDVPPISSNPTSENGLPTRVSNLAEFDRRQAAGDFGPVGPIGRFMEPLNSRVRAGDLGIIGAGAADAHIMQGMLDKTRADIAAEEQRLKEAREAADPDLIAASNKRLEQLRKAESVQTILQRVGVGLMIGGTVGLAHGRYSRPQPRFEAANRERELIRLAQTPPAPPPPNALAPPKQPRTVGAQKPKPKPPVLFTRGRPPKARNDND